MSFDCLLHFADWCLRHKHSAAQHSHFVALDDAFHHYTLMPTSNQPYSALMSRNAWIWIMRGSYSPITDRHETGITRPIMTECACALISTALCCAMLLLLLQLVSHWPGLLVLSDIIIKVQEEWPSPLSADTVAKFFFEAAEGKK